MAKLFSQATYQALDSSGDPISGAKWNFYITLTSTRQDTFTDNALSVAHANPVVADSSGRFAPIYLQDADYKAVLTDAADVVIQTVDPVHGAEAVDPADLDADNVFTKTTTWKHGDDVASATALTLGDGNIFDITGTTTITSIVTKGVGTVIILQFDAALTLTHNATDLVLPGAVNVTTAAGDVAIFEEYATGDWRLVNYQQAAQAIDVVPIGDPPGVLSNGTDTDHEIDIVAGTWKAQDAAANIVLGATTIDIEDTGDGGRLGSDTLDADTTYHVLSGIRTSDGVAVAGFSKTEAKPTLWDNFRRHGSFKTDSSSNLRLFRQHADHFFYNTPVADLAAANPVATTKTDFEVSVPDIDCIGIYKVQSNDITAGIFIRFYGSNEADETPTRANADLANSAAAADSNAHIIRFTTGATNQLSYRCSNASVDNISVLTVAYIDGRGRN